MEGQIKSEVQTGGLIGMLDLFRERVETIRSREEGAEIG